MGDEAAIDRKANWVLGLTSVAQVMIATDALVVSTALPTIRRHLGASTGELEWTVNAYVLSFAVLLMTGAALGDRFGRKRLFAVGLAWFTASSVACALSTNVGSLIGARAAQGAGAALMQPLALTLLTASWPRERLGKALGIFGGVASLGVVLGPLVGGAAVQGISWPWIFWINVPIGLITIALVLVRIDESLGPNKAIDTLGLVLVTGAAFSIVWALVRGNSVGWQSIEVVAGLAAGLALAVAFIAWELSAPEPMVPMGLFRSTPFSAGTAAMFGFWGSVLITIFFASQFLQTSEGYGPLASGLRLMPWGAAMFVVGPVVGSRIARFGERPFIVVGLLLQTTALASLALIARPHLPYSEFAIALLISGIGGATAFPAVQSSVMGHVAPQFIGKASGTSTMLRYLGGAFGVALAVALFAATGSYSSAQAFSDGFSAALGIAAGLGFVGAIAGSFAPLRRAASQSQVAATAGAPATVPETGAGG